MIEKVDTQNTPILTIGGRQFNFESFEFSQQIEPNPFPDASGESVLDVGAVKRWMDDSKPKTTFIVVISGEEPIKAIMSMFRDNWGDQEIAAKNLKNSMYGLAELIDVTGMVELSDALMLDEKRVRFCFESTAQVSMSIAQSKGT